MQAKQEKYPIFEANQVLTNHHLNQVFDYLDEQERLTRANLVGIGIVCGLEISLEAAGAQLRLAKGCGVTSQGWLIAVPTTVALKHQKLYKLPAEIEYPVLKDLSDADLVWELFSDGDAEPGTTPTDANFLKKKVMILFLELKKEDLRNCSPNNCDDRGANIEVQVRRLLITQTDWDAKFGNFTLSNYRDTAADLPEVPLPHPVFAIPADLQNYETTYRSYFSKITDGKTNVQRLDEAILLAFNSLKILIPTLQNTGIAQLAAKATLPATPFISIQYYYDFLRDLTAAYHELRDAMVGLVGICLPPEVDFPRHLSLGLTNGGDPEKYRTSFYPSPAVSLPGQTLARLQFLFERLNRMVESFAVPVPVQPFRITPSLLGIRHLSGKALPFYYPATLRPQWDPLRRLALSWHDDVTLPAHVRSPLNFDFEPYNFFRAEGHIGQNMLTALTLAQRISTARLPISVLHLNANAVGSFLDKHHALAHEAGAPRGGTLVVLHAGTGANPNQMLADFALPYRIEEREHSDCLCRALIRECEYEWFDSVVHLGNLSQREYRFGTRPAVHGNTTVSNEKSKNVLDDFYVIRIYTYEIQGQSLIPDQYDVRIPINDLRAGGVQEIARHLNKNFPNGLVFDSKAGTNKLVIRYFNDQTFRIEWAGLQGNQIRYRYEPGQIFRWQKKVWEPMDKVSNFAVTCRLRNEYRADEYLWLQNDDYFEGKYAASTPIASANDLIRWEKMIRERVSKYKTFEKLSVGEFFDSVERWSSNSQVGSGGFPLQLVGSWANGSWVSRNKKDNDFKELSFTEKEFLDLRRKVTGKRADQHSDFDFLVDFSLERENQKDKFNLAQSLQFVEDQINDQKNGKKLDEYTVNIIPGKRDAQKWR